jgi:hypothetical protein
MFLPTQQYDLQKMGVVAPNFREFRAHKLVSLLLKVGNYAQLSKFVAAGVQV